MKLKDIALLHNAVSEIKRLPNLIGIVQIGSSVYSEKYRDIDVLVFFNSILPPPELKAIAHKYHKSKLYLEGNGIRQQNVDRGFKIFIKFFSNIKYKKVLFGRDPYKNVKIEISKLDVAYAIRWHYISSYYSDLFYESVLSVSLNAMLTYANKFPKTKEETLEIFKKTYPQLTKYLPKNAKKFLRGTNKANFKQLYTFFEKSMEFFAK